MYLISCFHSLFFLLLLLLLLQTVNTSFRGLFRDVVAIVHGQFPMPLPQRSKLAFLLRGGLARLCDSVDTFVTACVKAHSGGVLNSTSHPTYKVVICSDIESANHFINELTELTSGDPLRFPKNFLKRYHIHIVSSIWVLDCVANYHLQKPDSGSGQYNLLSQSSRTYLLLVIGTTKQ